MSRRDFWSLVAIIAAAPHWSARLALGWTVGALMVALVAAWRGK